jgi:hypothetical protein
MKGGLAGQGKRRVRRGGKYDQIQRMNV